MRGSQYDKCSASRQAVRHDADMRKERCGRRPSTERSDGRASLYRCFFSARSLWALAAVSLIGQASPTHANNPSSTNAADTKRRMATCHGYSALVRHLSSTDGTTLLYATGCLMNTSADADCAQRYK